MGAIIIVTIITTIVIVIGMLVLSVDCTPQLMGLLVENGMLPGNKLFFTPMVLYLGREEDFAP